MIRDAFLPDYSSYYMRDELKMRHSGREDVLFHLSAGKKTEADEGDGSESERSKYSWGYFQGKEQMTQ